MTDQSTPIVGDIRRGWTSASNALSDSLCPGRHYAQRGIAEPEKDEDAKSGTLIHEALATNNVSKLSLAQREVFDACRHIEQKTLVQIFGDAKDIVSWRHRRFWVRINRPDKSIAEHSGEADLVVRSGLRIAVIDYKTLAGEVADSPRNMQLRDLAVLARGELAPVEEVVTFIVQPFVTHTPEVCLYRSPDLDRAQHEMFVRVIHSNNPESKRSPGEPQCDWCLAKTRCLEYQKWAGQMAHPQILQLLEVPMEAWKPEQLTQAAAALKPAQDLLDGIKEFLKKRLAADPRSVPGFMLQPGNKRESITNPDECYKRFSAIGGTLEAFMRTISVGKTKLREEVSAVSGAKGQALDKAINALTEGITEVSQNQPSLKSTGKR